MNTTHSNFFLMLGLFLLFNNYTTFAQNKLTYSHSIDLTGSDTRTITHIDGVSDSKRIAALVYDRNTIGDTIIMVSKQDGKIHGRYAIENKPLNIVSVIITYSFACFLDWGNIIQVFRRFQDTYKYTCKIEVKDKAFVYNELFLAQNSQRVYLASAQSPVSFKDGFLKVIEIDIQSTKKDTTISHYLTLYNKIDSLNFLSIYKPLWLMDRSENGTLGIIDFEGNMVLINNGKTYKTTLFESEYTTAIKSKVLAIQKSYKKNPQYETLEETDDIVIQNRRSVGILLSDSFYILTYHHYDTGILHNGIPITFVSEVYKYHLDEETRGIIAVRLYEHIDNNNKRNSKEPSLEISSYIDLSRVNIKSEGFLCGEYLFIYCEDILDFLENNEQENQTPHSFYAYKTNENKKLELLVFKIY